MLATLDTVTWIYIAIEVAAALGLIFLILMHSGKGGGLSDMFGGSVGAAAGAADCTWVATQARVTNSVAARRLVFKLVSPVDGYSPA